MRFHANASDLPRTSLNSFNRCLSSVDWELVIVLDVVTMNKHNLGLDLGEESTDWAVNSTIA